MNQSVENSTDIAYLKRRLDLAVKENDLLRKENQSQRKELSGLKQTFTSIVCEGRAKTAAPNGKSANVPIGERFQNEEALRQILEMQRKRLDELEKEHEMLKQKYEKVLFQQKQDQPKTSYSQSLANRGIVRSIKESLNKIYSQVKQKNRELENRLKEMATQHGKEIANYKQKIAQQDAELILNRNMDSSFSKSFDASYQNNYKPQSTNLYQSDYNYPKPASSSSREQQQQLANSQKQLEPIQNGNQYRIIKQFSLNKKPMN